MAIALGGAVTQHDGPNVEQSGASPLHTPTAFEGLAHEDSDVAGRAACLVSRAVVGVIVIADVGACDEKTAYEQRMLESVRC